jgi:hypothetical protein
MGDISKGVANNHTLTRQKNKQKNFENIQWMIKGNIFKNSLIII